MGLPFSMPSHVANGKEAWKKAIEIECYDLCTECLGAILVDGKYWLEGFEASNSFYLIPRDTKTETSFAIASFYADCVGFEHEISALAIPPADSYIGDDDLPWPLWPERRRRPPLTEHFISTLREGAQLAGVLWNGPRSQVSFKYDWLDHPMTEIDGYSVVTVDWEHRYWSVRQPIHLYCTGMRQVDPHSAYLCFYRAIENCTKSNGKAWIKTTLTKDLDTTSTVWCEAEADSLPEPLKGMVRQDRLTEVRHEKSMTNLLEIMRAMAIWRRDELARDLSPDEIAARLYGVNRCGIAHGNTIRAHDLADDFREVLLDLRLLRFLSRLAIEELIAKEPGA